MKNLNISALLIAISFTILPTACIGDLDTEPLTDTTLLPEKAWETEGSYEKYTANIYSAFALSGNDGAGSGDIVAGDQGEATFTRAYWNLQELTTDEAVISWSDEGLNSLQFVQWNSNQRFCQLNYNRMTIINAFCNEFLKETTDAKLNSRGLSAEKISEVNTMRAEVRTLRAFSYLILMDLYANVPFTDENTGIGSYLPEQKGRDFLFAWIEGEIKDVMDELPEKSPSNYGKVNRYVADMILANLYMNAEVYGQGNHYNDAITCLNDIIDNGGYQLESDYQWNFNADNDKSQEVIFPIVFDGTYAQSYGGTTYIMAATWGTDMAPSTAYGLNQSWSGTRAPGDLTKLFSEDDTRSLFYTNNRTQDITTWSDYMQGYSVVKFTNLTRDGKPGSNSMFADTDYPFYRLADAYLLYVEAVKRGGNGDAAKAVDLYNKVEQRAYGNTSHNINSLNSITLDDLLDERARELYWEGHRRTDLIRFYSYSDYKVGSRINGSYAGTMRIDDKYKIFPIPSTDISANTNLVQNKGY